MSFWQSGTGQTITGEASKAFTPEFSIIPNNTMALAKIIRFVLVEKENQYTGPQKYYEITWKISAGEFTNREVNQKIKVFDGKPEQIDRALNMLKLVMDLCLFKPTHANAPTDEDLARMNGNELGIKIREWSMPKKDGSGMMDGNFVAEVHATTGFKIETGVKMEVVHTHSSPQSAFSRNEQQVDLSDDVPF